MPPKKKRTVTKITKYIVKRAKGHNNASKHRKQKKQSKDCAIVHAKYNAARKCSYSEKLGNGEKTTRLHSFEDKLDIFRKYTEWIVAGKPYGMSPAPALAEKYGCHYNYPKALYKKAIECGSIENNKSTGRPPEYDQKLWDDVRNFIQKYQRSHGREPTHVETQVELKKLGHKQVPSSESLRVGKIKFKAGNKKTTSTNTKKK